MFARKAEPRSFDRATQPPPLTGAGAALDTAVILAPPPLAGTLEQQPSSTAAEPPATAPDASNAESVIGQDLAIEGQSITIRCRGTLHINGNIQAELHGREITVGQFGVVQGSIAADVVDVWGRVSGTIMGARVVLHADSEVEGDIHAKSLSVEDGASFEGRSRRVTDAASVAPQLTPDMPTPFAANSPQPRPPLPL